MDVNSPANIKPITDLSSDALDAARWRALLSSARIRVLGSAGFGPRTSENSDGYRHVGLEIWTQHVLKDNGYGQVMLTDYADAVIAAAGAEHEDADILHSAVRLLRSAGWICTKPTRDNKIPDPQVGAVWRAPNDKVEPRTVVNIGPHRHWPEAGDGCVYFTTPSKPPGKWGPAALNPKAWRAWARKTGALPCP